MLYGPGSFLFSSSSSSSAESFSGNGVFCGTLEANLGALDFFSDFVSSVSLELPVGLFHCAKITVDDTSEDGAEETSIFG